ncbi:hypothetical protein [Pseudomonas cedrina]|nr:hypothetical protein [Pseudomonas cedrina]
MSKRLLVDEPADIGALPAESTVGLTLKFLGEPLIALGLAVIGSG